MSRPPTEDELVERARGGDAAAFAALVRDHEEIAFRTAYLIARNAADAEDAAQVGLTKAWRALPRFRRGAPFRPWLLAIVANEARNRRRAAGRREGARPARRTRASLGRRGSVSRGEGSRRRGARGAARRARAAERGRPRRALVPLPARARRGGDRGGAVAAARHRQVADLPGARTAPREQLEETRMIELELRLQRARPTRSPTRRRRRFDLRFERAASRAPAACGRSRSASRSCSRCSPACSRSRREPAAPSSRSSASAARPSSRSRRCPRSRRSGSTSASASAGRRPSAASASSLLDLGASRTPSSSGRTAWPRSSTAIRSTAAARALAGCAARSGTGSSRRSAAAGRGSTRSTVDGERGLFVSGDEHFVMFLDENGAITDERHVPRRHRPALEPRAAAAAARRRPDARRGARARGVASSREPACA